MDTLPDITSGLLTFGDNQVHCLRMGNGSRLLIALHGFGADARAFADLLPYLKEQYTIVAFDLPGHGQTKWTSKYFDQKALMALIQGIKNDFGAERFSLIGHSLGGRLALNVVGLQASWVDRLVLVAPDGLKKNFWYSFATRNLLGKYLFRKVTAQPEKWLQRLQYLKNLPGVSEGQFRLAARTLSHPQSRERLAYVWPVMSLLTPLLQIIKWNIRKHKIPTDLFMGAEDTLFPPALGNHFIKRLKTARLHILPAGHHQILTEKHLPEIAACLLPEQP